MNFEGDAPEIKPIAFKGVAATCYYPAGNESYTAQITTDDFGGDLTWTYEGEKEDEDKNKCGENLTWEITEEGKLVISGTGAMYDYSVSDYRYAPWYEQRGSITSLEIDDNITYIGAYAFYSCQKIQDSETKLPENLTGIGEGAFKSSYINSVEIPEGVTSVGQEAFAETQLVKISLPSSLAVLPKGMLVNSHYLQDVVFSKGLQIIGDSVFSGCYSLNSVEIPEGVTRIGDSAFNCCGASKTFGAYYSCYNFKSAKLPSTLKYLGKSVFYNCHNLSSVNIPQGITEIKQYAFAYCYNLPSITIPQGITSIEADAFLCDSSLKSITFSWNAPEIDSKAFDGGMYPSKRDVTANCYYPSNNSEWTSDMFQNYGGKLTWIAKKMEKPSSGAGSGGSGSGGTDTGTGGTDSGSDSGSGSGSGTGGSGTGNENGNGSGGESGSGNESGGGNSSGGNTGSGSESGSGNGSGGSESGSGSTGTGEIKDLGFSAHSITLNGEIGVNFYLELNDTIIKDESATMEIIVGGKNLTITNVRDAVSAGTTAINDSNGISHNCYKFSCKVNAKEMTDTITAILKTSSGSWKETYSVQQYADEANKGTNQNLKDIVNAMLTYGAYAQKLLGYNTENLAGGSLANLSSVSTEDLKDYDYQREGKEENLSLYGVSLLLKEKTSIRVYYKLKSGNIEDYKFKVDGEEVSPLKSDEDGLYYIEAESIAAQDLEEAHTFSGGNITISNYSALSYVKMVLEHTNASEANKNAMIALYWYWNAAEKYFNEV